MYWVFLGGYSGVGGVGGKKREREKTRENERENEMRSSAKVVKEQTSSRYDVSLALKKLGELIRQRKEKSHNIIENAKLLNEDEKLSQALESEFSSWKNFCDDLTNALLEITRQIQDDDLRVSIENLAIKTTNVQSKNEEIFEDLIELHERVKSLEKCNIKVNENLAKVSRQKGIDQTDLLQLSERVEALELSRQHMDLLQLSERVEALERSRQHMEQMELSERVEALELSRQHMEQMEIHQAPPSLLDITNATLSAAVTVATVIGMAKMIGPKWQPIVLPTLGYCVVFIGLGVALFFCRKYLR